ncbi:tryptophan-rich sensory protein [Enterococcus saccharolyticus]|uniref:Sensory protein n=1 Tax=Candidatus Enterococcus willemsii TaxID=1857215 RepID=A0ABQ6YZY4_9ENTE|nr:MULTISPECIES: TspO/MBR family protein [Enterococcus]KAF1304172.1 sensory protein [Enterococcus sp. CU12B]MCD5001953.1 tryptophan-rich sensory protein [Enterococcus saccharolyticus]
MKWLIWLLSVIGIELTGIVSSFFAGDIAGMYQELQKPPLSPAGSVFGIMWTILYALIGTALFLLITSKAKGKQTAIVLFFLQQALNFSWSIIFFGGSHYWLASAVIIVLIFLIIICIKVFYRINRFASYLFIPYLLWCLFAGYLCLGIAILN